MVRKPSVLIVDGSEETREVLAAALARRGVDTLATAEAEHALRLARQRAADLIVLDLEVEGRAADRICRPFAEQSRATQTPLVVLGHARRTCCRPHVGEFVAKPYHYGPLIRKIEELLQGTLPLSRQD